MQYSIPKEQKIFVSERANAKNVETEGNNNNKKKRKAAKLLEFFFASVYHKKELFSA